MKITASDRSSLIRLASSLPKGDADRRAILAGLKVAARPIVKTKEYSWGKLVTIHQGSKASYPIHPDEQAAIKALPDGGKTSYKDETNRFVSVERVGDEVTLSTRNSPSVTVDLSVFE